MKTINFITNQPLDRESGGWCGTSRGLYYALAKKATVNFVGPIEPGVSIVEKVQSKTQRLCGLQGNFYYFSERRLANIRDRVMEAAPSADYDLFFGATPWLSCDLKRPFGTYIDALFPTYLRIFGEPSCFRAADLERIRQREEAWLQRANRIFWMSDWSRCDGNQYEDLNDVPGSIIGVGGNLDPPQKDTFAGEKRLLFASMLFREKGGCEAFEAFVRVQKNIPDLKLVIIGQQPPGYVMEHPGVEVVGFLDKSVPDDLERFRKELSRAFCLVHPTRMDTMGCILIEAGYWGCPSIAPARFGIPEIIKDKTSGLLLPDPFTVDHITSCIESLLSFEEGYYQMRTAARSRSLELFTYEVIADKMIAVIDKC